MENKYTVISPVRNEENYIEETIKSMIQQTILPLEWIIVNDGSTDQTPNIIEKYVKSYPWIKKIDRPKNGHRPGTGVVMAFNQGLDSIQYNNYDFIVKLDGDLAFEKNYFEFLMTEFDKNSKLGMASGTTYNLLHNKLMMDKMPNDHVRGAAKMYRKICFNDIGGLPIVLGWDTIDEIKAQIRGWETRSYKNLIIIHYKPIGFKQKKTIKRELLAGERLNFLGYHPLFAVLKCLNELKQKPYLIKGLLMLLGYLAAIINKKEKYQDKDMIKFLRTKQLRRISSVFSNLFRKQNLYEN